MATPEFQAMMEAFSQQLLDLTTGMLRQQQAALQTMMDRPTTPMATSSAARDVAVSDKYFKRVETFTGEQSWRD